VDELVAAIRQFATVESALPPFTWTSKADQILTKLKGVKHLSNRPCGHRHRQPGDNCALSTGRPGGRNGRPG